MFYLGLDENGGSLSDAKVSLDVEEAVQGGARLARLKGRTSQLGDFQVKFVEGNGQNVQGHFYAIAER